MPGAGRSARNVSWAAQPASALLGARRRGRRVLAAAAAVVGLCAGLAACGGGGGSTPAASATDTSNSGTSGSGTHAAAANVVSVIADSGPSQNAVNTLYTSVTLCVPGTTHCQTIDNIQVDTASFGLRVLSSVLELQLPGAKASDGNALIECTVFADGYSWGSVAQADVSIGGETASGLPIQVIGDSQHTTIPSDCSSAGLTQEDTVETFGANGIIGIGVFVQDCGARCAESAQSATYYSCAGTSCSPIAVPLAQQVSNPVASFPADNNGTILVMPGVSTEGTTTLTGTLSFGIDTESNNALGSVTVLNVDPSVGYLSATFDGQSSAEAFIDTGSNGNYFADSNLPKCADADFTEFYCPSSTEQLSATLQGSNGTVATVDFTVGNAQAMRAANPGYTVVPALAGTLPIASAFDLGLPFYYGRRVVTALETASTSVGNGPYVAF